MHNLIPVATKMFHGLLLVYQDRVVENPDEFARRALHLAERLLAGAAQSAHDGETSPPTPLPPRPACETAEQVAMVVSSHRDLLLQLRAVSHDRDIPSRDSTLH